MYAELDNGQLSLDVLVPTGKSNGLGMIDVASGTGFAPTGKTSDQDQARIAHIFCGRGYTLFVVPPGPTTKYNVIDMADHVQKAITYVKRHADQFNVDGERLGMLSTPAGVHLLSLVALNADDDTSVKAAGVYFAPPDSRHKDVRDLYVQANDRAVGTNCANRRSPAVKQSPSRTAPDGEAGAAIRASKCRASRHSAGVSHHPRRRGAAATKRSLRLALRCACAKRGSRPICSSSDPVATLDRPSTPN